MSTKRSESKTLERRYRIARILVEAALTGDDATARRHGVSLRTIGRYRGVGGGGCAKTSVAVYTDALLVVAWVNPLAQIPIRDATIQKVERHLCANNPTCARGRMPRALGAWWR